MPSRIPRALVRQFGRATSGAVGSRWSSRRCADADQLSVEDPMKDFIRPAVDGTLSVLKAAKVRAGGSACGRVDQSGG